MINDFRWDIQRLVRWSPVALVGLAAWGFLIRLLLKQQRQTFTGWLSLGMLTLTVFLWLQKDIVQYWWPAALLMASALHLLRVIGSSPTASIIPSRRELGLSILLLCLPFAFSFGTNMPVLWHSQTAAVFVVILLMVLIERVWQENRINATVTGMAICLLCVPPLVFQGRSVNDNESVYRLSASLISQSKPHSTPVGTVMVDSATARTLDNLEAVARQAGLPPGTTILDLTGDGPGLVLALSGRPLGVPWLVGGYDNSSEWASRLIESLPQSAVRDAWLLTSPDNPRAIKGWYAIISKKLTVNSHVLVATTQVRAPSNWGRNASAEATLCVWRPNLGSSAKTTALASINGC